MFTVGSTSAVSFSGTDGCRPLSALSFEVIGSWDDVLPSPRMTPWWFVPVMIVLVGGALWISTGIVLRMIGR